jgi:hypothetical protein
VWDERGSGGKRTHPVGNNGFNEDLKKKQMRKKIEELQKQNQELKQEVKEY